MAPKNFEIEVTECYTGWRLDWCIQWHAILNIYFLLKYWSWCSVLERGRKICQFCSHWIVVIYWSGNHSESDLITCFYEVCSFRWFNYFFIIVLTLEKHFTVFLNIICKSLHTLTIYNNMLFSLSSRRSTRSRTRVRSLGVRRAPSSGRHGWPNG